MSTLYAQVCENILGQIESGALKVGDRLPPEAEYAAHLGVSRSTLRLAFAELEAGGVLKRRKRAGTQIICDRPQPRFQMATSGIGELLSLGRDTDFRIITVETCQTQDAPQLGGLAEADAQWLSVLGARTRAGDAQPFSVNQVYVPAPFGGVEPALQNTRTSVYRAIEDQFDVSIGRVSQTVRAIACAPDAARMMGLEEGTAALEIEAHLFLSDGRLMEVSVATFDPARFQVRTDVEID